MHRLYRYWWNLKTAVSLLVYWIAVFVVLTAVSGLILGWVDPPDVLGALVGLGLIVGFLWKAGAALRNELPVTEEAIRDEVFAGDPDRGRVASHGGGDGVMTYTCENCGSTLYDDWDISASSSGYACRNCGHFLTKQHSAGTVHAYGAEEWDGQDDGSTPAPWDEEYGDPAPWDDDFVDKPWDDEYGDSAPWDDDDLW